MRHDATLLVGALRDPATTESLEADGWTALLAMARAEQLIGTLSRRLSGLAVPDAVAGMLEEARVNAEYQRRSALWEGDCARRALADYPGKVVLMKGTAYAATGLKASEGRHIGDLDIMVVREDLGEVEAALLAAGWEWVKEDSYDDGYYRDHMHELPPLIHKTRDRMIDVHHTILPLTARPRPDAAEMLADAVALENGLYVFSPTDMVIHSAAHLFADGELDGGLRNLWDIHCLLNEFSESDARFWQSLQSSAQKHELWGAVHLAARLAWELYGTEIPAGWQIWGNADALFVRRLTARDNWGRGSRKFTRLIFYIRSHWLRMPPLMLMRHLWVKWRKG
jgi:Uncharacterised nucleotidyltransferase